MRIGIDIRCLAEGRRTGVEEYTLNLLENLLEIDTKNEYVLFFNSYKKSKINLDWIKKYGNVELKAFGIPNKFLNFLFWYFGWPKIDKMLGGVDVFFMPNLIFGSVSKKTKLLVTFHDLSFERYPEMFSWKRRFWHMFINPKKLAESASKIIAVSESTRDDLISVYRIKNEKIRVIYNGISEKFRIISRNDVRLVEIKEKYNLPYKSILFLGTIEPRKNIIALLRAYNMLQEFAEKNNLDTILKYKLIIAGEKGWLSDKIYEEIGNSKYKQNIRVINSVLDEEKEYFYNLSSLFVYPSFFEGFGFPPLEAMKCGVPVITSNNSSLPEIVSNAGVMIDPAKPDELFKAMETLILNSELADSLKRKGSENSRKFSWKKAAEEFLDLLQEI